MITVAIPTYRRGAIALATVEALLALEHPPDAIILADQTHDHPPEVYAALREHARNGTVRWMRFDEPSIPHAMNAALLEATTDLVLFLDDDIEPSARLIEAHEAAHRVSGAAAVVGQILQPGEEPSSDPRPADDLEFRFSHNQPCDVRNVMAGNLSVRRESALAIGGFDENFVGAAHRFETDFAYRLLAAGQTIRFEPSATIRHLKLSSGGLRAFGDHRTSASPYHSVGDYYFALSHIPHWRRYALQRMRRNVLTRYHARHPWTIPAKLVGEVRGFLLARKLHRGGARLARS